jgi:hypothetical protein
MASMSLCPPLQFSVPSISLYSLYDHLLNLRSYVSAMALNSALSLLVPDRGTGRCLGPEGNGVKLGEGGEGGPGTPGSKEDKQSVLSEGRGNKGNKEEEQASRG